MNIAYYRKLMALEMTMTNDGYTNFQMTKIMI